MCVVEPLKFVLVSSRPPLALNLATADASSQGIDSNFERGRKTIWKEMRMQAAGLGMIPGKTGPKATVSSI